MSEDSQQNPNGTGSGTLIVEKELAKELERSYIDYAMSVIVGRSIPDVRDGLKPVQRRILYSMNVNSFYYNRPYHKCATIVGHVLGHYHPHGDSSVYGALVRQAQGFSLRYPLIDGQGNFGSIDGDEPAAYRYTEARLEKISNEMLDDLDKDTVDFVDNFDGSEKEPSCLPAKIPQLLLNGSTGIAVGMSTNIAPHNLREVANAICYALENGPENLTPKDVSKFIKGPDFPTGGLIMGKKGALKAISKGKGRIVMRGVAEIKPGLAGRNKDAIIITEIPYAVKKADLIKEIADKVKKDTIPEIMNIRDESDRTGMRIFIGLKQNADANSCLNRLYKRTRLQTSFSIKNLCLVNDGIQPKVLNYVEMLQEFIKHRENVIERRSKYLFNRAKSRLEIVNGLIIAIQNIDEVVKIIKKSASPSEASVVLQERFSLNENQAKEILKMRLSRLTNLQTQKLMDEREDLKKEIERLKEIIESKKKRYQIIKRETEEVAEEYGDERRTKIEMTEGPLTIEVKETIPKQDCVILLSNKGKVKRMTLKEYDAQNRGGKGKIGAKVKDDDFIKEMFVSSSHDTLLLFTSLGRAYSIPAFKIPLSSRYSLGKAIVNYVELRPNERVVDVTNVKEFNEEQCLVFATQNGIIKRTELSQFDNIRRTGIIAINVREDDSLVCVKLCGPKSRILLATKKGYTIHFKVEEIRTTGRNTMGVKGIELRDEDDEVVDLIVAEENVEVLTFTKQGYGKRTKLEKYRLTHRAGKGVINIKLRNDKDEVIACKSIKEPMNVVMASKNGVIIRTRTKDVRSTGRATQGVIIMRLGNDDEVSGVAIAGQDKSENGDEETESSDDESKERDEDLEKDMQENSDTDTKDQIENATQEEKPAEDNELADVEKQIDDEEQSGDIEKQVDDEEQSEDENIPPEEE